MLSLEDLSKSFGGVKAVDGCSFSVREGAITALIGPNGAGKTTAFQCVSGFLAGDAGQVKLNGVDISMYPPWMRARAGLSRTFQQVRLWPYLTVEEHLLLALHDRDDRIGAILRGDADTQAATAKRALERVGLPTDILGKLGSDLSYGQSKLLELARALLWLDTIRRSQSAVSDELRGRRALLATLRGANKRPPRREGGTGGEPGGSPTMGMLLLDEPVAGVHPVLRQQIVEILKGLRRDGETILVIEHDMDFVRSIADHIIVMAEGRVLFEGAPENVLRNPEVMEAYLGVEALKSKP